MSLGKNPHKQIWYEKLKEELTKKTGLETEIAILPERYFGEQTLQDLAKRFRYLVNAYPIRAKIHTVVGHSIGGALGLYMAQYIPIEQLTLVGSYMPPNLDWNAINCLVKNFTVIYESQDPSISEVMSKTLIEHIDRHKLKVIKSETSDHLNTLQVRDIIYHDF